MSLFALLCTIAGFLLLGLATDGHGHRHLGQKASLPAKQRMRWTAWAALAVAFVATVLARGWIFGPVLWSAVLMLGAGIAFLALNFLPARPHPRHKEIKK